VRIVFALVVVVACGAPVPKPPSPPLPMRSFEIPNVGTTAQVNGCDHEPPVDHGTEHAPPPAASAVVPPTALPGTGAIQGVVTDEKTCDALRGVTVIVTSALAQTQTAITDERGAYKISDLPPGDYLVSFYYADITIDHGGIHVGVGESTPVFQKINQAAAGGETIHIKSTAPTIWFP
jgi:hypothetical protein